MIKDGGKKNKYNVDVYEMRPSSSDTDNFAVDNNYGSGKYYEKDLSYLMDSVNSRELPPLSQLPPTFRTLNGKFSIGNVTKVFAVKLKRIS